MEINMNGNDNDPTYRYRIPAFNVTIAGQGNGIYTVFKNIDDISKRMNHPKEVLMKYIASITGSNYNQSRDAITGSHTSNELKIIILQYIKFLVMCPECSIPETIPQIEGNKKNSTIKLCCFACKGENPIKQSNKQIDKGTDIIIKYLKAGSEWKICKGSMVSQRKSKSSTNTSSTNSTNSTNTPLTNLTNTPLTNSTNSTNTPLTNLTNTSLEAPIEQETNDPFDDFDIDAI